MKKDIQSIEKLMEILTATNLTDIEFEQEGFKVKLKRSAVVQLEEEIVEAHEEVMEAVNYKEIKSAHIGNFFYTNKDGSPMIEIGDVIKEGQDLGYVTTIGVKSPIKSTTSGTIREILVENGSIVDYGKVLVKVEI